jgi:WD40 repeat protein/serine/threonine protein kinase
MAERDLSGLTLGEFVVCAKIDRGGYGEIYCGEQPRFRREVVIKVLRQKLQRDGIALQRFIREAHLASRLEHPYSARIYDFGVERNEGIVWIAMERVNGVTLERWLQRHGPMSLEVFVPFFECVAQVLEAAHKLGIVHRDLKPSNIMVIEEAGQLLPKLLDFGIAKAEDQLAIPMEQIRPNAPASGTATPRWQTGTDPGSSPPVKQARLTPTNVRQGSPPYMAPEQWKNSHSVGPAADIYSLGIIMYEALVGRLPYIANTSDAYYYFHCHGPTPSLGWADLNPILHRALAKLPEDRHRSVLELASELRAALRSSPPERLRSAAQHWDDRGRPRGLLWGSDVLASLTPDGTAPTSKVSKLECAFLTDSQREARRARWVRRLLVASAVTIVVGGVGVFLNRAAWRTQLAEERARSAQQVVEATKTQAELDQGQAALLHGELGAQIHLGRAYQRADHSPSTKFMYARSLQPKLAEQGRFASSFGRMWSAAFSPDGRQIVTTDDRTAQLRDAQTGQLLATLPHGGDTVYQAVYSADGTRLVTAGGDGGVRIWEAASGAPVRELRPGSAKPRYYAVAMSPDGKLVAAIDTKGELAHVWEAATGALIAEIRNDASEFPALAFSAEGRWLATTGGNDVHVFDTRARTQTIPMRGAHIQKLAFDPTGPRLLTGAATGDAAIWSIPSGARIRHLREIGDPVDAVAFSPDGQLVVVANRDGAVQVWQTGSGKLQSQFNPRHSKIRAVEFDRTSKLVLIAGTDGTVVVADVAQGMPVTVLEGPQSVVWDAHFDPTSRRAIGASLDGTARVWDATSPYRRWGSPPIASDCGLGTTPEPNGRFIAVGCKDHPTRIWDTSRDQLLAELPSVSHVDGDFTSAFPAVSGTGDRAAIARGSAVEVYEVQGPHLLRTVTHGAAVNAVAFASTGRDIVSGSIDGSLTVTRDDGATFALPTASGGIDAVAFLPDARVVAADAQRRLRVYGPGGAVLADLKIPMRVMSLRIEGAQLVTIPIVPIYPGKTAPPLLVDVEHYRVVTQLAGHIGRVVSARWVTGHQILTAGADGTARLWDGLTGQLRQTYQGGSMLLADATLAPDGLVIAGGADGLLRFWDAVSERLLWTLQAHTSQIIGIHVEGRDIVTRGFSGELSRWTLPRAEQVIEACADRDRCAILQR